MNESTLFWWFVTAVTAYTLREIPHIWSKSDTYKLRFKWMYKSRWFCDSSPQSDSWFRNLTGLNTFDDAYHFFGNLPRIHLSILCGFEYNWIYAVITFAIWALVREAAMALLVSKK